jgi:hypothetical protein
MDIQVRALYLLNKPLKWFHLFVPFTIPRAKARG